MLEPSGSGHHARNTLKLCTIWSAGGDLGFEIGQGLGEGCGDCGLIGWRADRFQAGNIFFQHVEALGQVRQGAGVHCCTRCSATGNCRLSVFPAPPLPPALPIRRQQDVSPPLQMRSARRTTFPLRPGFRHSTDRTWRQWTQAVQSASCSGPPGHRCEFGLSPVHCLASRMTGHPL